MSDERQQDRPYAWWEGTPQWAILDRALTRLVENRDLLESTRHEYVVGFLCEALAGTELRTTGIEAASAVRKQRSREALQRAQELMRPYRQPGHSLVDELLAERRAEAARE